MLLPTGSYSKQLGTGGLGIQANIPVSIELGKKFVTHWNLGATYTPSAHSSAGDVASTWNYNYGFSIIWLTTSTVNFMTELASTSNQSVDVGGALVRENTFFINPGMRFAINYQSGLQVVPGFSVPIQLGHGAGNYGGLVYLSFEHPAL